MKQVNVNGKIKEVSEGLHKKLLDRFEEMLAEDIKGICEEVCGTPDERIWKMAAGLMRERGWGFTFENMDIRNKQDMQPGRYERLFGPTVPERSGSLKIEQKIWIVKGDVKKSREEFQIEFRHIVETIWRTMLNERTAIPGRLLGDGRDIDRAYRLGSGRVLLDGETEE